MKGWVYVISNKAMPGLVKVGYSMKAPQLRAAELNHTGSPHPYEVEYECLVDNPYEIEQRTHLHLRDLREGKEWFRCAPTKAAAAVQFIAGGHQEVENFPGVERAEAERQRKIEEAQQKLQKAKKNQRDEIHARYGALLAEQEESAPYPLFAFVAFLPVWMFMEPRNGTAWVFTALIALLAGFFAKEFITGKKKQSPEYLKLISQRDVELAQIEQNTQPKALSSSAQSEQHTTTTPPTAKSQRGIRISRAHHS